MDVPDGGASNGQVHRKESRMQRIRPLPFVCASILATAAMIAIAAQGGLQAASGDLLWEDILNLGFYRTEGHIAGIQHGRVYAVISGAFTDSPSSNAKVITRAYDQKTGDIAWTDTWEVSESDDFGRGAVADDIVLVAASTMLNRADETATYNVRAYDGRTGAVLWSDTCGPGSPFNTGARNVIAHAHQFVVAGDCQGRGFLRAYDAPTGAVDWETALSRAQGFRRDENLAAAGRGVFVVEFGPGDEWFVRGLDSRTGESLWISAPLLIGPFRLLAAGDVVAVTAQDGSVLRILDASTGQTSWKADLGSGSPSPFLASLEGNRVSVMGSFGLRVYDARSGRLLSEDPDGVVLPGTVKGDMRFVAGSRIPLEPPMGLREFFLQAFDLH